MFCLINNFIFLKIFSKKHLTNTAKYGIIYIESEVKRLAGKKKNKPNRHLNPKIKSFLIDLLKSIIAGLIVEYLKAKLFK